MQRLTVLVGAGASMPLDVPGTDGATNRILALDEDAGLLELHQRGEYVPPFRRLRAILEGVYRKPNFEHMVHALESIDGLQNGRFVAERSLVDGLTSTVRELFPEPSSVPLATALLFDELHKTFSDAMAVARQHARWTAFVNFWRQLSSQFQLDVITLNYDTCIDEVVPDFAQGFEPIDGESAQRFDPTLLRARDSAGRLMHLHGSLRFGPRSIDADPNRFAFEDDWNDLYLHASPEEAWTANRGARSQPASQAGRTTIVGHLITGLQKPDKIAASQPYQSYFHTAVEWLCSNPKLLIIGYGFSDLHINAWLNRMPRFHRDRLRLCILDYAPIVDESVFRWVPPWAESSPILYRAACEKTFDFLHRGIIQGEPWTANNGRCRLDLRGFLIPRDQSTDVLAYLNS